MRPGGGKSKGSAFERQVCVALSRWVSDGKREDIFWRSAMSGGRATVRGKRGKNTNSQLGDISSVAPEGHALTARFVIECKHVASLDLEAFLFKRKGALAAFWKTLTDIADANNKVPLLIARQNRLSTLMICTPAGFAALGLWHFVQAISCPEPTVQFCYFDALQDVPHEQSRYS